MGNGYTVKHIIATIAVVWNPRAPIMWSVFDNVYEKCFACCFIIEVVF